MRLAELQELFWGVVTGHAPLAPGDERHFIGTAALPSRERVQIYAEMYVARLVDVLRRDYPLALALVGDGEFERLAKGYFHSLPSIHPSIDRVGERFATYLERPEVHAPRADLTDLARLEWSRGEAFIQPSAPTLGAEALASLPAEAVQAARFRLSPCLVRLTTATPVAELWSALESGEAAPAERSGTEELAIWRKEHLIFHVALDPREARAVDLARSGAPLAEICAPFSDLPEPTQAAFEAVGSWFEEGWVTAIRSDLKPGETPP